MKLMILSCASTAMVLMSCQSETTPPSVPDLPSEAEIVREVVREAVKSSTTLDIPGVSTESVVDCVIDNASDEEIKSLGDATLLQSQAAGVVIVAPILQRPETLTCLAEI